MLARNSWQTRPAMMRARGLMIAGSVLSGTSDLYSFNSSIAYICFTLLITSPLIRGEAAGAKAPESLLHTPRASPKYLTREPALQWAISNYPASSIHWTHTSKCFFLISRERNSFLFVARRTVSILAHTCAFHIGSALMCLFEVFMLYSFWLVPRVVALSLPHSSLR